MQFASRNNMHGQHGRVVPDWYMYNIKWYIPEQDKEVSQMEKQLI